MHVTIPLSTLFRDRRTGVVPDSLKGSPASRLRSFPPRYSFFPVSKKSARNSLGGLIPTPHPQFVFPNTALTAPTPVLHSPFSPKPSTPAPQFQPFPICSSICFPETNTCIPTVFPSFFPSTPPSTTPHPARPQTKPLLPSCPLCLTYSIPQPINLPIHKPVLSLSTVFPSEFSSPPPIF